jgi:hypothetical protein
MAIDRTTVLRGPCVLTWTPGAATSGTGAITFFSKDDVTLDMEYLTWDLSVAAYGKIDERMKGSRALVNVTPVGVFSDDAEGANYGSLWPLASTPAGTSIVNPNGAYDGTLVATDAAGNTLTLFGAYIKKMPSLTLSSQKTACGQMQFASIGKKNTARTDAAFMFTIGTGGSWPSTFDTSDVVTDIYSGVWGSVTGMTALDSQEGFTIDFDSQTKELMSDTYGIFDEILQSLTCTCKFKPIGPTIAQLTAAAKFENTGALSPGASMGAQQAADLTVSGTTAVTNKPLIVAVVKQAFLKKMGLSYSYETFRTAEVEFVATRTVASGATGALFSVTKTNAA